MTKAVPRPVFKLEGSAEIKHLNIRKEGDEDSRVLMCDVKLLVHRVPMAFCANFDDALFAFLWRADKLALFARSAAVAPVRYERTFKGCTAVLAGVQFFAVDVKKVELSALDGGLLTVGCSITLEQPATEEVALLAKSVQDEVPVFIEGQPDLFDGDAGAKAAKPRRTKSAKQAALALDDALREQGTTAAVVTADGDTLITFGTGDDPMFERAMDLVRSSKRASITQLQRILAIGYTRAAKLLEALELAGVVSPMNTSGHREVLA